VTTKVESLVTWPAKSFGPESVPMRQLIGSTQSGARPAEDLLAGGSIGKAGRGRLAVGRMMSLLNLKPTQIVSN